MSEYLVISILVVYLAALFGLAYLGEKYRARVERHSAWLYTLSLMAYCTAWTFYGSVGKATADGIDFLPIYIGPLLTVPLWWFVLRKMVRITRVLRISSIADFLASRYGKNARLGTLVALACLFGVIPYIALQIKAISQSIEMLCAGVDFDPSFSIALILTLFAILFGARNVDANQRKTGLMSAIAFESGFKLLAFLALGFLVVYGLFEGPSELFARADSGHDLSLLTSLQGEGRSMDWVMTSVVSAFAFLLLPRQFHVSSVEAVREGDIKHAMRWVPIYFLAINLFVIPIALAGMVMGQGIDPDFYVLGLPLAAGFDYMALFIFLGGFAASTSMILVSTTSLSTMMSNYVFNPWLLSADRSRVYHNRLLWFRRASVAIIMLLAFLFFRFISLEISLVGIGMISFIAVAQLAPAFFGGMYWKRANTQAAFIGISGGLAVWFFMLVCPQLIGQCETIIGSEAAGIMQQGIQQLGARMGLSITSASIILSLTVNLSLFFYFSLARERSALELNQAELFVDIFRYSNSYDSSVAWRGTAYFPDIRSLLEQFIGKRRSSDVLERYARRNGIDWDADPRVDSQVVSFAERVLTGIIGPASARIMVSNVVQEEDIRIADVVNILHESKETIQLNKELQAKSQQLARVTENLRQANLKLTEYGELKNEFLYTVTHELRTPITSIRAMAEIIEDDPEMKDEEKAGFVHRIIQESERMSSLISDVLDLEKFESGQQTLHRGRVDLKQLIQEEIEAIKAFRGVRPITIHSEMNASIRAVYADEVRVRQVLNNLLSNAVKYCDQEAGDIRITAYDKERSVKVNVSNNGKGISAEDMASIFDKFYQVKHQTRRKPSGHGLGLAICKNIIEMHQGQISVAQQEGRVRFSFTLPAFREN